MRILITGITGFAGGHLAEALLTEGQHELHGTSRHTDWPAHWRPLASQVVLHGCDLADRAAVTALVREVQPQQIYHLAGYAHAGKSFQEPEAAWTSNLRATLHLYDAVYAWGGKTRILYVGSGLVYGDLAAGAGHNENAPLRPVSPYASSKAAADLVGYQYTRSHGLDIVRARPFNHFGPAQTPDYAVAHFAQQLAAIERGRQPALLETGNLRPQRDLTDVRDVVAAYRLLMAQGRTGEVYNVGSGKALAMQTVVERLLTLARVPVEVRQKAALVRSTETDVICADCGRLRAETGWQPRYSLEQSLIDTLDYWRTALEGQRS
jgi:GDP-4-dehydro-6-deoxy-D-mannose reductase